jgi:hypothetical protein
MLRAPNRKGESMNPIIISTIIASASFIVSIFAANWLNQQHAKTMQEQNQQHPKLLFEKTMNARFDAVDARFDTVDFRLDNVDRRLGELDRRVGQLENILFKPSVR